MLSMARSRRLTSKHRTVLCPLALASALFSSLCPSFPVKPSGCSFSQLWLFERQQTFGEMGDAAGSAPTFLSTAPDFHLPDNGLPARRRGRPCHPQASCSTATHCRKVAILWDLSVYVRGLGHWEVLTGDIGIRRKCPSFSLALKSLRSKQVNSSAGLGFVFLFFYALETCRASKSPHSTFI